MKMPHKASPHLIQELSVNLYTTPFESFREAISNALDEGSKKILLEISPKCIVLEDWGEGIDDMETFVTYGHNSKAALEGEVIGSKGLGKLSLLGLGEKVYFKTNNNETGMEILMTKDGFNYETKSATRFLEHRGTRIEIPNPKIVPSVEVVIMFLKKTFGLRIAKGIEINVNSTRLESKVDADEHFMFRLKGGIDVTGNLKVDKKAHGSVDVYIKHVFITSLIVDPERTFSGWVNCNQLVPTTGRNDINQYDPLYDDFLQHLKTYVSKFPKKEDGLSKAEVRVGNKVSKLLRDYLKHMNLLPKGSLPLWKGEENNTNSLGTRASPQQELGKEKKKPETENEKIHASKPNEREAKRITKTDYGIQIFYQPFGNEEEPIFFNYPNQMVFNITNDIYKFATKDKSSLGPSFIRLVPYIARAAIQINPESKKWDHKQTNLEVDKAIRFFLHAEGEI